MTDQPDESPEETVEQRRELYRIQYPVGDRPWISFNAESFEVIDLAEHSLRFEHPSNADFLPGDVIQATINFSDGPVAQVTGSVLHTENKFPVGETVLLLNSGLDQRVIVQQQGMLVRRYPARSK